MKIIIISATILLSIYIGIGIVYYAIQENFIFHPDSLAKDFEYNFDLPFQELNLPTSNGDTLNTLLFTKQGNNNLIVYYHGNAGSLQGWGDLAPLYLDAGFDFLIYDYRGFGKSTGKITNQKEFLEDAQNIYNYALSLRPESEITVVGYSIGSGPASYIASNNFPKRLILKAPYYSLLQLAQEHSRWLPVKWLFKYPIPSYKYLANTPVPITIFHGVKDEVIPVEHSRKLIQYLKEVQYFELPNHQHSGMNENPTFVKYLQQLNK